MPASIRPHSIALGSIVFLGFLAATLSAQQSKVFAPHDPVPPKLSKPKPLHTAAAPRSMVGGLWMIDANFKSSIYIKNGVETSSVSVTPVLYLSNGARYALAPLALEPAGTAVVNINDALRAKGIAPWATLTGYVEVDYTWPWDPLCVTVTSVDVVHSVTFTYALIPSAPKPGFPDSYATARLGPSTLEGMWWKQEGGVTGFVALSNVSSQPVSASVHTMDNAGNSLADHSVTVSPHGTKTITLTEILTASSTSGGVQVTYSGLQNSIIVSGGLEDPGVGYSAMLPFAGGPEGTTISQSEFAELGLMVGAADPMMSFPDRTTFTPYSIVRNLSDKPIPVTPTLWWMQAGSPHSFSGLLFTVPPHQTTAVNVTALLAGAGLSAFNGAFNLVLSFQAARGGLLMASGSVDQTNTYVFEAMPRGIVKSASKSLSYWSTGNGDDTMVTLWNPADEEQDFVLTLFFLGGHYNVPMRLSARATRTFNISEILQQQIPDNEGNMIPANVHEGSLKLSGSIAENQHILVAMDSGIYNVRKGTCYLNCATCNGSSDAFLDTIPFAVGKGGSKGLTFTSQWNTGTQYNLTNSASWNSSNTSVASVSVGSVKGVAPGAVSITADADEPLYGYFCTDSTNVCPYDSLVSGGGGGNVFQVTGVSPTDLILGTGVPPLAQGTMTISGTGFNSIVSPVAVFNSGTGLSTGTPTVNSDTMMTVSYTVDCSTVIGTYDLTVGDNIDGGVLSGGSSWPEDVVLPSVSAATLQLGGQTISGTQSVVVGQKIALSATPSLPTCMSLDSQQWSTAPGTANGGFSASNTSDSVSGLPVNTNSSYTFYWVAPGNPLNMTYQFVLAGGGDYEDSPVSNVSFNVAAPAVTNMSTPTGSVGIFAGPVLGFGPTGITFTPTVTTPSGDSGVLRWAQLIGNDTYTLTTSSGTVQNCVDVTQPTTASGTGLDSGWPYASGASTKDSPSLPLVSSGYKKESRNFSATMYLLWNAALPSGCTVGSSCTSIDVPLGSVGWGFSGTATYSSGNWSLTSSSKTTPSWSPGTSYPTWSDYVPFTGGFPGGLSCH